MKRIVALKRSKTSSNDRSSKRQRRSIDLEGKQKDPRTGSSSSSNVVDWPGPHTVVLTRSGSGFGFTLRHFVVYPPASVLDWSLDSQEDRSSLYEDYNHLPSDLSLEPQDTIFVKRVTEGSPADHAGLNTGDRIIAVNGDSISGKSYQDVIGAIQQSSDILKLLVVPKDDDILQMAYQSQAGNCMYSSTSSLTDRLPGISTYHYHSHSSSDIVHGAREQSLGFSSHENLSYDPHEVRHSYPLSHWGHHAADFRLEDFAFDLQCHRAEPFMNDRRLNQVITQSHNKPMPTNLCQDQGPDMASNITCSIPCKSKYSFGLYFPPKTSDVVTSASSSRTISAENLGRGYEESPKQPAITKSRTFEIDQRPDSTYRKNIPEEGSALSSSAKSRDFFIRYSSDKAASDRNRYSPRHSAYERYSVENRPVYGLSRSQTATTISASNNTNSGQQPLRQSSDYLESGSEHSAGASPSRQYIPVYSGNRQLRSEDNVNKGSGVGGYGQSSVYSDQTDPNSGSRTFILRIPHEQQTQQSSPETKSSYIPVRQRYGTTRALSRSSTAQNIEIQKSIGKPIVSQRKYQFETGKSENISSPNNGGYNRYKTEIEKIRTQPKFSSVALRKASFEQSPDRDPPGFDDPIEPRKQPPSDCSSSNIETAKPTMKVRAISAERYNSGIPQLSTENVDKSCRSEDKHQGTVSTKIIVSTNSTSTPLSTISLLSGEDTHQYIVLESGHHFNKNTAFKSSKDGHSRVPSHDSNADSGVVVCGSDISTGSLADSGVWMKSYHGSSDMLDAVDAVSGISDSGVFSVCSSTTDQDAPSLQTSRPARKPSYLSAVNAPAQRMMSASDISVMHGHPEAPHDSLDPAEPGGVSVTMRKKLQESLEDQANKLHRRTSYLMATARDRTNMAPIEQAFVSPQVITDHSPQHTGNSTQHHNSVKLNRFFGEMIPTIAEGVETKSGDQEEPPEIIRRGHLLCKISVTEGKKCSDRSWKPFYAILRPTELLLTRDKEGAVSVTSNSEDHHIPLKLCMVEFARDYAKKKKNVFRMSTHNECEYLFQTEDRGTLMCWIQGIKSINEPMKADKMEELMSSERLMQPLTEISLTLGSKMSPQLGHKGKKLSALSFKSKMSSSPSMKRKKANISEKDKDESIKKGWKDRIPMMKSLKKHSEDSGILSLAEHNVDTDKYQFGVLLEDCFPSPHNEHVPLIVELCTRIVEARGLEVVGVYRVPGNSAAVNALTEEFNRGIDSVNIDNEKLLDINVISSLLKSFFRKLPEPLIPTDAYDAFIEANRCHDESKRKLKLKRLIHLLPSHHNETFKHMAEHLNKVASYGHINKMDAKNLAIMFGPTLVRKKGDDTVSLVTDMSDQCRIVESIILHHEWFFGPWDQDSYIPMETTVETVPVDDGQALSKDDDEEADAVISTKEIISSIVGAASKKLRQQQQQKSLESLDTVDSRSITSSSTFRDRNSDDSFCMTSLAKSLASITSSLGASEEYLEHKSPALSTRYLQVLNAGPKNEQTLKEFDYTDTSSCVSSSFSRHLSDDPQDKNDELEISHGLSTSLSRDAINRLKRIGDDVTALLHTFEQKQLKEREHRRREQEMVEREHRQTQLELEQEENHSVEDWLVWKGSMSSTRMPDLVSSSYIGDKFSYDPSHINLVTSNQGKKSKQDNKKAQWEMKQINQLSGQAVSSGHAVPSGNSVVNVGSVPSLKATVAPTNVRAAHQPRMSQGGSHEDILSQCKNMEQDVARSVVMRGPGYQRLQENPQKTMHLAVDGVTRRPPSIRNSFGRRHGSLDSLIDLIDNQDKRASWASSDSEDGSDLLSSITATFDQKLQVLLNPRYKLTGTGRRSTKIEAPSSSNEGVLDWESLLPNDNIQSRGHATANKKQAYTVAALIDSVGSFRDPSLHRSATADSKIGIASRFQRNDLTRAASSSPVTTSSSATAANFGQHHKSHQLDFKTFLSKPSSQFRDLSSVVLTKPKKLESNIIQANVVSSKHDPKTVFKSGQTARNCSPIQLSKEIFFIGDDSSASRDRLKEESMITKLLGRRHSHRRHTVGGIEDFVHMHALSQAYSDAESIVCSAGRDRLSAWEQLQPAVRDPGTRNMQAWIQRERLRGSTPDLSCPKKQ